MLAVAVRYLLFAISHVCLGWFFVDELQIKGSSLVLHYSLVLTYNIFALLH